MASLKKELKYAIIPGICIGLMNGIGFFVKREGGINLGPKALFFYIVSILISVVLVGNVYRIISWYREKNHKVMSAFVSSRKKYDILVFFLLMIFLLPVYLCFWPGIFSYDAPGQLTMYLTNDIMARQPILHTLLMGKIITLGYGIFGSTSMGIGLYFFVQLIIFALLITYVFDFLYEENAPVILHALAFFIFALFPPVTILLMSATKDNYFSLFLVDFVIANYKLVKQKDNFFLKKDNIMLWIIYGLGAVTFRHNTIYAFIVCTPIFLLGVFKRIAEKKKCVLMLAVFVVLYLFYRYPFTNMVATEGMDPREMMSVPVQQVTRVYIKYNEVLPAEEKALVEKIFQGQLFSQLYHPLISDMPKFSMNYQIFVENKEATTKLYVEWFKRYPKDYLDSVAENTYGFWYMWPKLVMSWLGENEFLRMSCEEPLAIESKIPALYNMYQWFGAGKLAEGRTLSAFLFMPALYFYVCFVMFFYGLYHKRYDVAGVLSFILVIWMTYLLGPVVLVRYVLFLYMLLPVELAFVVDKK